MSAKIRPNLVLWGVRMGFMSYGWDAGVLGGVLLTPSFQSAMKVWMMIFLDSLCFPFSNYYCALNLDITLLLLFWGFNLTLVSFEWGKVLTDSFTRPRTRQLQL